MPTKKRRVGFIPRCAVLDLINKLSFESNLSNAKILNILVEEARYKRGIFNIETGEITDNYKENKIKVDIENTNNKQKYDIKNEFNKYENIGNRKEILDNEIYSKFLMFLQFQEKMKKETN